MRIKRLVAIGLMVLVLGVGAPSVFAEGPQETPGSGTERTEGPQETPGQIDGPQETPGEIVLNVIITLATTVL